MTQPSARFCFHHQDIAPRRLRPPVEDPGRSQLPAASGFSMAPADNSEAGSVHGPREALCCPGSWAEAGGPSGVEGGWEGVGEGR